MSDRTGVRRPSVGGSALSDPVPEFPSNLFLNAVWTDHLAPFLFRLLTIWAKVLIAVGSLFVFALTSMLLYSLLYWFVVPKQMHTFPIYFDYNGGLIDSVSVCGNVTLGHPQWNRIVSVDTSSIGKSTANHVWDRPSPGFEYDIVFSGTYPSNTHNQHIGPVMFTTTVMDETNVSVVTKRPLLVDHKSWMARLFRDALFMVLSAVNFVQDTAATKLTLIDSFLVKPGEKISHVQICMQPGIHLYDAKLNFVSKLTGFMYLFANHPVLVGIAVVGIMIAVSVFGVLVLSVYRRMHQESHPAHTAEDESPMNAFGSSVETNMDLSPHSPVSSSDDDLILGGREENVINQIRRRVISDQS